jgi:hypothetical protein
MQKATNEDIKSAVAKNIKTRQEDPIEAVTNAVVGLDNTLGGLPGGGAVKSGVAPVISTVWGGITGDFGSSSTSSGESQ